MTDTMFRKSNRSNIRQRKRDSDSDEGETGVQQKGDEPAKLETAAAEAATQPAALAPKPTTSAHTPATGINTLAARTTKLSFGDDEDEGTEFQVKKSAQSRRIAKKLEKERQKRLQDLKAVAEKEKKLNQLDTSVSIRKQMEDKAFGQTRTAPEPPELPKKPEEPQILEEIQIPDEDGMSDDSDPECISFRPKTGIKSAIPDANTISNLKKQRRSNRNADEFISLVQDTLPLVSDSTAQECDSDADESEQRIEFDGLKDDKMKESQREALEAAQEEELMIKNRSQSDSSDSDDELSRWEKEQITKGVGLSSASRIREKIESHASDFMDCEPQTVSQQFFESKNKHSIPSHLSRPKPSLSINDVLKRLQEAVTEKQQKIEYLERRVNSISVEEESMNTDLRRLEEQQKEFDARRQELVQQLQQQLINSSDV